MKKRVQYLINFIIVLVMILTLCACEKKESRTEAEFYLYSVRSDYNGISSEAYNVKATEKSDIIDELLEILKTGKSGSKTIAAIPKGVTVNGYDVTQGVLTVDFSKEYYDVEEEKELLYRSAIVLTLVQVEKVDYVAFTVQSDPLIIGDEIVEAMNESHFSSDIHSKDNHFVKTDFTLYFADATGKKLKKYELKDANYSGMSKEEFIIYTLVEGPKKKGYTQTLTDNVLVKSVSTVDNICYVDFDENFLTEQSPVPNRLVIYSIVNSILELTDINKVQISVNGNVQIYYHNDIYLGGTFIRNLDLIEK